LYFITAFCILTTPTTGTTAIRSLFTNTTTPPFPIPLQTQHIHSPPMPPYPSTEISPWYQKQQIDKTSNKANSPKKEQCKVANKYQKRPDGRTARKARTYTRHIIHTTHTKRKANQRSKVRKEQP
jgi:hypothetical protein